MIPHVLFSGAAEALKINKALYYVFSTIMIVIIFDIYDKTLSITLAGRTENETGKPDVEV